MTNPALTPLPPFVEEFRTKPFPTEALPEVLQHYVRAQAAACGVGEAVVAMLAPAVAAGLAPDHWSMSAGSGAPVGLRFNLVLGLPPTPSAATLLAKTVAPWELRQREALRQASHLDAAVAKRLQDTPVMQLPSDLQDRLKGADAWLINLVRRHWAAAIRRPAFLVRNPDAAALRAGLASSADHTILAVFDDLITALRTSRGRRADLAALLAQLAAGSQLAGPGASLPLMHPTFSFVSTTGGSALAAVLAGGPLDPVLRDAIFLQGSSQPVSSTEGAEESITTWQAWLESFLEARKEPPLGPGRASSMLQEGVTEWNKVLESQSANDFAPVRHLLGGFADLPLKLAGIFLRLSQSSAIDAEAFLCGRRVAEWVMVQMLIAAHDARKAGELDTSTDARERMLAKIVEFGPIDFISLRRRFKVQDKAIHQPILEALLEEKRVRLDETGRLIAA